MIDAEDFISAAADRGFDFWTGVPCSFLTPLMNAVISSDRLRYASATSEGEAVAIAAGAWLAGKQTVVMCQNSGLGNTVNPLTSLNYPARIPTLLITTWRGQPGLADEPQHELMGRITQDTLDVLRIPHAPFPADRDALSTTLDDATEEMRETGLPFGLVLAKGSVAKSTLSQAPAPAQPTVAAVGKFKGTTAPKRIDVLDMIRQSFIGAGIIATTGFTGRELFTLKDDPAHFYTVGSMGGASAIGLGAALNTDKEIVVLDGDGAALMKLGNLATIGAEAPENLTHILLDNGCHESTGGQLTVSAGVDFAAIASACGYAFSARADGYDAMLAALQSAKATMGPRFLHFRVGPSRVETLARPDVTPRHVAHRFQEFLA